MKATKRLTIFAGVNGAGKSTLFYSEENKEELGVRLNSDELIHELGGDWRDTGIQLEAGKEILRRQQDCMEKGLSFNRETTLSGTEIFRTIEKAKELDYEIHLRYVGVNNAEIAKERIKRRVALGGHGVSEGTVERRYERTKEKFLKVISLCDTIEVYDNSGSTLVYVGYSLNGKLLRTNDACPWLEEWLKEI